MISLQFILIPLFVLLGLAATWFGIKGHNMPMQLAPALVFAMIWLINKPMITLMLCFILFPSELILPGMGSSGRIYNGVILLVALLALGHSILRKTPLLRFPPAITAFLLVFVINLILVMGIRGAGIQILDANQWGGFRYFIILLHLILFAVCTFIVPKDREVRVLAFLIPLASLLPCLSELLFILSGGTFFAHYRFIALGGMTALTAGMNINEGYLRLASFGYASIFVMFAAFSITPATRNHRLAQFLLTAVALAFAAISGHRYYIAFLLLAILTFRALRGWTQSVRFLLQIAMVGIPLLIVVYTSAEHLPWSIQRSLSWLPGLNIDPIAKRDSMGTLYWRLDLWEEAIREIPRYLLIGKGYAYPAGISEALRLAGNEFVLREWAILTSAYHNGPLSLLIGLGIVGLASGYGLMLCICWRHIQWARKDWPHARLHQYHLSATTLLCVSVFCFTFLYGDAWVSFPVIFFWAALCEIIVASGRRRSPDTPAPAP